MIINWKIKEDKLSVLVILVKYQKYKVKLMILLKWKWCIKVEWIKIKIILKIIINPSIKDHQLISQYKNIFLNHQIHQILINFINNIKNNLIINILINQNKIIILYHSYLMDLNQYHYNKIKLEMINIQYIYQVLINIM